MNPIMGYELAKLHGQDLTREAEIDRIAREAVAGTPTPVRRRLGRGIVRLGLLVAGVCCAENLEARRAPAAG